MVLFLTSSPTGNLDGTFIPATGLDERNGFLAKLRSQWPANPRCLIISASPTDYAANDEMCAFFHNAVNSALLPCAAFDVWDNRTEDFSRDALLSYGVVFLGGGHVPTQNAFFHRIGLPNIIRAFPGIVIGISAGSMNCAELVYAEPELDGEATAPSYRRFLPGLGLTALQVLPHHQLLRYSLIDGMRLFEDIVLPDSLGKEFIAIPDGSYVYLHDGCIEICGDYYTVKDGIIYE